MPEKKTHSICVLDKNIRALRENEKKKKVENRTVTRGKKRRRFWGEA
jgi:hypothetical protein